MSMFRSKSKEMKAALDTGPQVVLQVEGMHCTSCGLLIDDELEDLPGVRSASTDVRTGRVVVRLEEGAADTAALVAAVQQAGDYTARIAD